MVVSHRLKRFYHGVHAIPGVLRSKWHKKDLLRASGSRILVYHGVCHRDPYRFNHLFITARQFEEQLKLFIKYGHVLSLEDYYAGKYRPDRFNICLTFDDGFASHHDIILPLLNKYKLPATFFVTAIRKQGYAILWNDFLSILQRTGPIAIRFQNKIYQKDRHGQYHCQHTGISLRAELQASDFTLKDRLIKELCSLVSWEKEKTYWLQLTEEEIKNMAASPFVSFGCHGYYHNDLGALPLEQAVWEATAGRAYLEDLTGKPIHAIAFPYGSYTKPLLNCLTSIGFTQLLTTECRSACDLNNPLLKERMTINPYLKAEEQLLATIKGHYGW